MGQPKITDLEVDLQEEIQQARSVFPSCITKVKRSTNQVVGTAWTTVSWDTEIFNTAGAWSINTPTKIIVPAGKTKVQIKIYTSWENFNTGDRLTQLAKNGSAIQVSAAGTRNESGLGLDTGWMSCVEGDYFETIVYSYAGVDLSGTEFGGSSWIEAIFEE